MELRVEANGDNRKLWVDGAPLPVRSVQVLGPHLSDATSEAKEGFSIWIHDHAYIPTVARYKIEDLPQDVQAIAFVEYLNWGKGMRAMVNLRLVEGNIVVVPEPELSKWSNPWDVEEFFSMFCRLLEDHPAFEVEHAYHDIAPCFVSKKNYWHEADTIASILERTRSEMDIHYQKTVTLLNAHANANSLVARFDFPESVKVPCEQYLLYFAQFLKDAGVEATTDLKHEAGEVLFTVTPSNSGIALEKIRQALHLYLNVPSASPATPMTDFSQPLEAQRYMVVVEHLKGQLAFANMMAQAQQATIQAKDETLYAKDQAIYSLQARLVQQPPQVITPSVFVESVREIVGEDKKEDCEQVLGGTLEITKYKGDGFNVNFAKMLRAVKDHFTKTD